jgi:photosystem II stability/assembly factor-like uncharacterized protein
VGRLPAGIGARIMVIDPEHPKRVYAAAADGLMYRSDDAGQTWAQATRGLPGQGIVALALDPRHPMRLYGATASGALYASEDGAQSWRSL